MGFLRQHWKKLLLYSLILGVLAIPACSVFPTLDVLGINRVNINGPEMHFESAKWKDRSQIESGSSIRYQMMGDLLERYEFFGMSGDEVVRLLGESDRVDGFGKGTLAYWLTSRRSLAGGGSVWMVLKMDEQPKVTGFQVVKD
jgi:hypothetical protein